MKSFVVGVFATLAILPAAVSAYDVAETIVSEPYEVMPLEYSLDDTLVRVGALEGYPVMYEFSVDQIVDLELQLLQRYQGQSAEPLPLSLIVVRVTYNGVAEVGRLQNGGDAGWQLAKHTRLGVDALSSDTFVATIEPGTYRVEVSSPTNEARYALLIGNENQPVGYFETLSAIRTVQRGLGYSFFYMLTSSYVYYPIGIILLLIAIQRTWKLRNKITNTNVA